MRRRTIALIAGAILALAGAATAQKAPTGNGDARKSNREGWYLNVGLGYGMAGGYPAFLENRIDVLETLGETSNVGAHVDLGVYWPVSDRSILGAAMSGVGDRHEADGAWLQINQYSYAASYVLFIKPEIGRGFFVRADAGLAQMIVQSSGGGSQSSSDIGLGAVLGGGYSLPITRGTRILFSGGYGIRRIEGDAYSTGNIDVSFLF